MTCIGKAATAGLLLLAASGAAAAPRYDRDMTWHYLQQHRDGIIFLSSCAVSPRHKAVILMPSDVNIGSYVVIQEHSTISAGTIEVAQGHWHAWGFIGGDQDSNARLADWLMRRPFRALPSTEFNKVYEETPSIRCPETSRDRAQ